MKAKNVLYGVLLLVVVFLSGCKYGPDFTYKWKVAVVYTNGDKDTLNCQYDSFKGNECFLYLKTTESGLLTSASVSPCIVIGCGVYSKPVACEVRKYEILSLDKIPLEKK